jgi:hypothetical protein
LFGHTRAYRMAPTEPSKRPLGLRLVSLRDRELVNTEQACLMFINQVLPEAIPAEVEASPPEFRHDLEQYVASLGIGTPEWDKCFLVGGIYHIGDRSPEVEELYRGIARKNRVTAEALLQYFQGHRASQQKAEPVAAPDPAT